MVLEFAGVIERLKIVTNQRSDRAMAMSLGYSPGAPQSWKKNKTIPYEACFRAFEKTGITVEWLVTGKGPQKFLKAPAPEVNEERLINDFIETINDGILMRVLRTTEDTSEATMKMLGRKLYSKQTGNIPINSKLKKEA